MLLILSFLVSAHNPILRKALCLLQINHEGRPWLAEMAMYRIGPDLGWFPIRSESFIRDSGPINLELGANPVRSGSELHQHNSNSGPVTHI